MISIQRGIWLFDYFETWENTWIRKNRQISVDINSYLELSSIRHQGGMDLCAHFLWEQQQQNPQVILI